MAHVEKRDKGRWRARYRGPDGRERSKTFERRADAERWLAGVEVSKSAGDWIDPALGKRTFADWAQEWSATIVDLRPSTLDRDRRRQGRRSGCAACQGGEDEEKGVMGRDASRLSRASTVSEEPLASVPCGRRASDREGCAHGFR